MVATDLRARTPGRCTFYLGTHEPSWLARVRFPLCVSHRRLHRYRQLPTARCVWVLDSGRVQRTGHVRALDDPAGNVRGRGQTLPGVHRAPGLGGAAGLDV